MKPNKKQKYRITTLSPLHIGSGNKILRGFEFHFDRNRHRTIIYDMDEIFDQISNNRRAIDELSELDGRNNDIHNFVRKYNLSLNHSRSFPVECHSREILEFIRDGLGKPMIPGSSLKGSIRTVVFNFLFSQMSDDEQRRAVETGQNERRDMFAGRKLDSRVFGSDPTSDIMKAFAVGDSFYNKVDVKLGICQVMSLTRDHSWYWKKGYKHFPMSMVFEYLKEDVSGNTVLNFSDFFISDHKAIRTLHFNDKIIADFSILNSIINNYSQKLIDSELDFFYKHDDEGKLSNVTQFYEMLKRQIPANSEGCILRLGWGSGWTAMTGNYLQDFSNLLEEYRRKFRMGKRGAEVFPKSRKIFMNRRTPQSVMGWIKMEMIE